MYEDSKEFCPHCNANLQGDPIPEGSQESYGSTHFSRKIGLTSVESDSIQKWQCPDCSGTWMIERNRAIRKIKKQSYGIVKKAYEKMLSYEEMLQRPGNFQKLKLTEEEEQEYKRLKSKLNASRSLEEVDNYYMRAKEILINASKREENR